MEDMVRVFEEARCYTNLFFHKILSHLNIPRHKPLSFLPYYLPGYTSQVQALVYFPTHGQPIAAAAEAAAFG